MKRIRLTLLALLLIFTFYGCKKNPDATCTAVGKQVTYQILSITGGCPTVDFASWTNASGNTDENDTAAAGFSQTVIIQQTPQDGCYVNFGAYSGTNTCEITARILVNGTEVKRGTGNSVSLDYSF